MGDEHVRVRGLRGAAEGLPAQVQRGRLSCIPGHLCGAGQAGLQRASVEVRVSVAGLVVEILFCMERDCSRTKVDWEGIVCVLAGIRSL